ncbi:hypothetical protein K457DRAFT_140752 [Linnemannia elongata AG-77]|uniref:Galactose oxidase n=1 Tax=Linnemannia elongata AG-77 TaxID=1314771 RepID=A0A197JLA8_9FUNG|nr:hypothetical protein K457DRAFT_140752 [Linnemannia elongata AG-77]
MYSPVLSNRLRTIVGLLSLSLLHTTSAQSPISVARPAFITLNNESTFYIQGGRDYNVGKATATNQFFSLDLSQPAWEASKPPWTPISISNGVAPGLTTFGHSFSVSPDQQTLSLWDPVGLDAVAPDTPGVSGNISLTTMMWTPFSVPMKMNQSEGGLQAVAHPRTGLVYTPAGYNNTDMAIYDFKTHTVSSTPLPPQAVGGWRFYTFNWNELRGTFFLWGGQGKPGTSYFYEFDAAKMQWTEMITKGAVPPRLRAACMAPAYGGAKMVLFGGNPPGEDSIGTLYILDVPSMTWTQGPSIDPSQNRSQLACTVNGDNFIAWGGIRFTPGSSGKPTLPMSSTPLIYNIYTGEWTTKYVRGSHPYSGTSPPGGKGGGGDEGAGGNGLTGGGEEAGGGTKHIAAIAGSVAAVLVLLLAIAFFLLFRRSRRRRRREMDQKYRQHQPEEFWLSGASSTRTVVPKVLPKAMPKALPKAAPPTKYIPRMETDRYVPGAGNRNKNQLHISPPLNLQQKYGTQTYSNSSTLDSPTNPYPNSSHQHLHSGNYGSPPPSPTHSYAKSSTPSPVPPYPIVNTSSLERINLSRQQQQEYYEQLQKQLEARQWELAHYHDQQRLSGDSQYTFTAYSRNPEDDGMASPTANTRQLRLQISALQTELNRLHAILHP